MSGKKEWFIDLDECTGCDLCVVACKDEFAGTPHMPWTKPQEHKGQFWMNLKTYERGQGPKVKVTYLPLLCQHCDNAPCMKACPEDAILRRPDGIVWIDQEKCTGCGLCQEACPYDVIYMNRDLKVAQKCTGCAHLVDLGEIPRCADVCPRDAILFADEDDPRMLKLKAKAGFLHPEFGLKPRVYYKGLPKPFISGTVVNGSGTDVIRDAKITATDLFNNEEYSSKTDEFGDYWIRDLEADHSYLIVIEKPGYWKATLVSRTDIDRNLGDTRLFALHEPGKVPQSEA
jgi:Fe-S-cluster-containing dehydrogenase component